MHTSAYFICVLAHPCVLDGFGRGGDQPILCVSVLTYWTENTRFDTPQPNDSPAGAPGSHAGSPPPHAARAAARAAAGGVWEFCAFWSAADFVASTYGRDLIWQFWREGPSTHEFGPVVPRVQVCLPRLLSYRCVEHGSIYFDSALRVLTLMVAVPLLPSAAMQEGRFRRLGQRPARVSAEHLDVDEFLALGAWPVSLRQHKNRRSRPWLRSLRGRHQGLYFVVSRLWLLAARRQNQLCGGEHRIHCLAPRHLSPDRIDPVVVAARKVYDDAGHDTPRRQVRLVVVV